MAEHELTPIQARAVRTTRELGELADRRAQQLQAEASRLAGEAQRLRAAAGDEWRAVHAEVCEVWGAQPQLARVEERDDGALVLVVDEVSGEAEAGEPAPPPTEDAPEFPESPDPAAG